MKTLLLGHRGTGKTSLLRRIRSYYRDANKVIETFDLDAEVESIAGRSVGAIFAKEGERVFRTFEAKAFTEILEKTNTTSADVFVAAGAGFEGDVPSGWRAVWIRRASDMIGRVFEDRPRLESKGTAFEEFHERKVQRDPTYARRANATLWLPEGFDFENDSERAWFTDSISCLGGEMTLLPQDARNLEQLKEWIARHLRWGVRRIELRDDLLPVDMFAQAADLIPSDRLILSFRAHDRTAETTAVCAAKTGAWIDWPSERGAAPAGLRPNILSFHFSAPNETFLQTLERARGAKDSVAIVKLALPVSTFAELEAGHRWRSEQPEARAFLPSSADGRWSWYRMWLKNRSPVNFLREDEGSSPDQPLLLDWLRGRESEIFAAVLGDPVAHSRTPSEQDAFFSRLGADIFAIRVTEIEFETAVGVLRSMGLRFAAITAPLKEQAYQLCEQRTEEAERAKAVNTLVWNQKWVGTNTDLNGFQTAFQVFAKERRVSDSMETVVWGGGGTLGVIETALSGASYYSARSRQPREGSLAAMNPKLIVWAVGRARWREGSMNWPPGQWNPSFVLDLNYSDDSPGKEYAAMKQAGYISGLPFFRAQAAGQREFWRAYVGEYLR